MQSRPAIPNSSWCKSSYSGANTSECLEAAAVPSGTAIRDSKDPLGPQLAFGNSAWTGFITALRSGRID
ncbi:MULTISPECIES: DUF397 domain-containing protein [unclassified Streptomyces]|uniref:DUF397 domain-containing protein n=1 Tax=unclassified Streptomyces TaxID=2593676 RepID=UPI002023EF80|nr:MULTISPECIES: DUF397 domain-containing protein [unclassified Streptomyces]WSC22318.1 DUF397 domain-containing protein [Streptomyces sp. NBC_01766]